MSNKDFSSLNEAVAHYHELGFKLIPLHSLENNSCSCTRGPSCPSPGKHPRVKFPAALEATGATWQDWLRKWPLMNIGIMTGAASGLFVVDVDPRHGGDKSLEKLFQQHGEFETYSVTTGGSGKHYYLRLPAGKTIKNSVGDHGLVQGIDIRSDGGLVVAPPSATQGPYTQDAFLTSDSIRPAPIWLVDLLTCPPPKIPSLGLIEGALLSQNVDAVAEGGRNNFLFRQACSIASRGVTGEALDEQVRKINEVQCKPPLGQEEVGQIIASAMRYDRLSEINQCNKAFSWPQPRPIGKGLREVQQFDPSWLPSAAAAFVTETSLRMSCPPDFPAIATLVAMSSLIGTKATIRPKRNDTWTVPCGLWGAVVGSPGAMKSPPLKAALEPLEKIETKFAEEFFANYREYEAALERLKKSKSSQPAPESPARRRALINDSTYETLVLIARDNPQGFLMFRDELAGLLHALDKDNQKEARGFFLSAWSGDSSYSTDRISRGSIRAETVNISLLGTIQPSVLESHFRSALEGGAQDDGLMQRFQLMVYPDLADYKPYAGQLNLKVDSDYEDLLDSLNRIPINLCEQAKSNAYEFDDEAQNAFDNWLAGLEKILRGEKLSRTPALHGHFSKYRSLLPKLALTLHLASAEKGRVSLATLQKASSIVRYLAQHARRIYSLGEAGRFGKAQILSSKIKSGKLADGFTSSDILQHSWGGLKKSPDAQAGLSALVEHGWLLAIEDTRTGGRPSKRYYINPLIHEINH